CDSLWLQAHPIYKSYNAGRNPFMRLLIALLWLVGAGGIAVAEEAPLPRPRPPIWIQPQSFREAAGPDFDSADVTSDPTECNKRIQAIAVTEPLPRLIGPEACGGSDMLRLEAALRSDGARIELKPAPVLRCEFAESVAAWLRDEAAPRVEKLGAPLRTVETYDDFECRGRNRVAGAKLSEHGKGNAVDLRAFVLADGRAFELTDVSVPRISAMRSATARVTVSRPCLVPVRMHIMKRTSIST